MKIVKKEAAASPARLERDILIGLYKKLLLARLFEERVYKLINEGIVLGSVHLSNGEEASAVGTISALSNDDYILPTHRGHAQVLAKGADPRIVLAELAGKETGFSRGMCGSIPVGAGLAIRHKKLDSVVACFFGDGASNQGWFYELLNLASLWNLPVILVCINNLYGMGMAYNKTCPISVHEKAQAFRIKSVIADGNDVEDVYIKAKEIVNYSKKEKKPSFIECLTYRYMGHSSHDSRPYRPAEEIAQWKAKDPVKIAYDKLYKAGMPPGSLEDIKKEVIEIIDNAEKFAKDSKFAEFEDNMQL
jgi:TPP-dependent pyruvate/acetoin dehydrogenase alpha subunit